MSAEKPDCTASAPYPQPPSRVRGRPFQKGNGGRRPGSRNKATVMHEALLRGEAEAMKRVGCELALAGNTQMLTFFLGRMLPKERLICLDLPKLDRSSDAVDALAIVIEAMATGKITPGEGAAIANVIALYARTINAAEYEERLGILEKEFRELRKSS